MKHFRPDTIVASVFRILFRMLLLHVRLNDLCLLFKNLNETLLFMFKINRTDIKYSPVKGTSSSQEEEF